jgi:hypothetical protein
VKKLILKTCQKKITIKRIGIEFERNKNSWRMKLYIKKTTQKMIPNKINSNQKNRDKFER